MSNPLLHLGRPLPFDQFRAEHVEPAILSLVEDAARELDAIASAPEPLTYDSTFGRLETATERLGIAMGIVEHLESVQTTPELRQAYGAVLPHVSEFWSSISLHSELYKTLKAFGESDKVTGLSATQRRLIKKTLDDFHRNGADLPEQGKNRLRAIDSELSQLTTRYAQNTLDGTNAFELYVDEERLAGVPETARVLAREAAEAKGKPGYRLTLQAPCVIAVLTFAEDRSLREEMWRAFNRRGLSAGDNLKLISEILRLRKEKANLLGFANFADFVTQDRMAESGAQAKKFVEDLTERTQAAFARETEELRAFQRELEGPSAPSLEPWDVGYYAEKQRRALYNLDEEALRPYFSAEKVVAGAFSLAEDLFGVKIDPADLPVWNPAVKSYRMRDEDGTELGVFYTDLYPRESKRDGAWMHGLIAGTPPAPHVALFCANSQPPSKDSPSLLSFRDVETIFHEFGHLLHHLLSRVDIRSLACTNVAQDFVELPSQIMENWCSEKSVLDRFAHHYETGEPIPLELVRALLAARNFRAASAQMRQLGFAAVDLALHMDDVPSDPEALNEFSEDLLSRYSVTRSPKGASMIASFGHLFSHPVGYAGGYYSYKWAEVLDADAFTSFKKNGLFDRATGQRFRDTILARGDSQPPLDLFVEFMGRAPDLSAMLERQGLSASAA